MIELIFVIVVVGILAAVFMPRFERDNVAEAAYQIARHIRLAQHHALLEDRFDDPSTLEWKGTLWRITFVNGSEGECYQVWSDRDASGGNPGTDESAIDPLTKKRVWGNTTCSDTGSNVDQDILLWKSYGVDALSVCGVATSDAGIKHVAFDHLGRPGSVSLAGGVGTFTPLTSDCVIAFQTNDGHSAEVTVYRDTGFVKVSKIDGNAL